MRYGCFRAIIIVYWLELSHKPPQVKLNFCCGKELFLSSSIYQVIPLAAIDFDVSTKTFFQTFTSNFASFWF